MKKFKNVFLLAAMAVSAVFVGCDKENDPSNDDPSDPSGGLTPPTVFDDQGLTSSVFDGKIQATVAGGDSLNSKIDFVKAFVRVHGANDYEVASAPYSNGGFTLNLPETVPILGGYEPQEGITVSDTTVKSTEVTGIRAYKGATEVGTFHYYYYESADFASGATFVYADKNVSITGSFLHDNEVVTYNRISLKRGWNKVYGKMSKKTTPQTLEFTSTEPSGLKWIFLPNNNF